MDVLCTSVYTKLILCKCWEIQYKHYTRLLLMRNFWNTPSTLINPSKRVRIHITKTNKKNSSNHRKTNVFVALKQNSSSLEEQTRTYLYILFHCVEKWFETFWFHDTSELFSLFYDTLKSIVFSFRVRGWF